MGDRKGLRRKSAKISLKERKVKKLFRRIVISATLLGMLSIPATVLAQPTAAPAPTAKDKDDRNERHPDIRAAIQALERAKADLKKANHDFGGHRESALKACDEAIEQLRQALAYDKK